MTNCLIKILIVGDYAIFRSGLRMLLETNKGLKVIGEASDLETALEIMTEQAPDILLIDLSDLGGNALVPFLKSVTVPVLIMVGEHDTQVYQRFLRVGVRGLISKEENSEVLFKAIEKIHDGEIWFDRTMMSETIKQLVIERQMLTENPKAHVVNALTEREMQVVDLICKGLKNRNIAAELFITETTVRHHLTSVFNKLGMTSRLELVIYAFKNNLVKAPTSSGSYNGKSNGNGSSNGAAKAFVSSLAP